MGIDQLHTWVINLDRARDRLAHVSRQLDELGLPWTRFAAVDAQQLTPHQQAELDESGYRRRHGMAPLPGELGCYLSHVEVMRDFLASEAQFALVLEDDVVVRASLPKVLEGLLQHTARWDMVKLSAVHSGTPQAVTEVAPGHHLAVMLSQCTGSSAYLVNRRAAQRYLQHLLPMRLPFDHAFDRGWQLQLKVRLVTPTPCEHYSGFGSTLGVHTGSTRKLPFTRRWPTYWHRLNNEVRRLLYGLRETRFERRT